MRSSFFSRAAVLALVAYLVAVHPASWAQSQPPEAVNQQDEIIQIPLRADQSADDVLQILRSGDKSETNSYVTRVYELHNATAYELKPYIKEAADREKGSVRAATTRPTDGGKPRHFLVVTTTPRQVESISAAIAELDTPGFVNSQGSARKAYRVKFRLASDLGQVLLNTRLTNQAKVFADNQSNTLYFDDSADVLNAAEDYLKFFDVPSPQVEFDVQIVELKEGDSKRLGLDWDAWKRSIGGQFGLTANQFEGGERFARLDALLTLDANVLANFLNYTVQSGNGRLVQRSRLTASNLQPAVISDAKRVPSVDYVRSERDPKLLEEKNPRADSSGTYENDEAAATAPRVVTIAAPVHNRLDDLGKDAEGLRIKIQPVIATDAVVAAVEITANTLSGYDPLNRPIIASQQLTSTLGLVDGQRLLLGTIERDTAVGGRRGIPGLKDIPVLGYLFGVENSKTEKSRLFIVATPKFWNIRYGAKNIAELKTAEPLVVGAFESKLEDGKAEQVLGEVPELNAE